MKQFRTLCSTALVAAGLLVAGSGHAIDAKETVGAASSPAGATPGGAGGASSPAGATPGGAGAASSPSGATPGRKQTPTRTQQGAQPSVQNMDANAQRAHSRDPAKAGKAPNSATQPTVGSMDADAQRAHSKSQTGASQPAGASMKMQGASAAKP